jgi:HAD superfamily hydrolase (TIGR01509 family)
LSKTELILEKQFGNLNTNEAYYQWAMKETGLPKAELEHLVEYIIQNIYELRDTNIFEKLPKVKLAIATNHLSAIHTRLQPFQDHFDYVLVSADAEVQKPEPAFYKKLIEGLNEKPENIFFIDDSPENIEGAKAV